MLDDLREQVENDAFSDEGEEDIPDLFENYDDLGDLDNENPVIKKSRPAGQPFMGLHPHQRFVVSFILLIMTALFGFFFLIATGTIVP